MDNEWNRQDVVEPTGDLQECAYGSRLIGARPSLVLHGGGNTSVKTEFHDITGSNIDALYVKGSGWDLATIDVAGFTPLSLQRMHDLTALDTLSDADMMAELSAARLDPSSPQPSVESLLHAFLPHRAVQHSHADVIVTLTNAPDNETRVREIYGDSVVVIPYVMPGFDLAKLASTLWAEQAHDATVGMVLLNHGLFTFGESTRAAYDHHIDLITLAEQWVEQNAPLGRSEGEPLGSVDALDLAALRCDICEAAGKPLVMTRHKDPVAAQFVRRDDLADLADRGPLTPDHVIRTKRVPMVGRDVDKYVDDYTRYYRENEHRSEANLTMLDPAPRVVVDRELGVLTLGESAKAANVCADIYHHTMPVLERAEDHLGGYEALAAGDLFDVEYWDLEQAKLRLAGPPPELGGTIALVTGAASGIGRACAAELLARGCAVAGFDRDARVVSSFDGPEWLGLEVDVTDSAAQRNAIAEVVERYGGLDIVVVAAGVFGPSAPISELDEAAWQRVHDVNVTAVAILFAACHQLLARSPVGGRVVVIGSKNVSAPGPGAAAYSTSKAALAQLARVAALEWAPDGIRLNTVHPDGVFDTGLWTDELLAERAEHYSVTVEEYKIRNLLGVKVTSVDVARVVAELCSSTFSGTTGAHIPVDGGNPRVI